MREANVEGCPHRSDRVASWKEEGQVTFRKAERSISALSSIEKRPYSLLERNFLASTRRSTMRPLPIRLGFLTPLLGLVLETINFCFQSTC